MISLLVGTLLECEAQFREYARQHSAKGTPEATEKALTNLRFAQRCGNAVALYAQATEKRCDHATQTEAMRYCPSCGQAKLPLEG